MPYLQNIVQPFSRKKKQDPFLSTYICTILVHVVQLVGLVSLHLQGSFVGLVGPVGLVCLVGLIGVSCQVGLILGIFLLFDLIQKYFQMEILSLKIHKNLMTPKSLIV